MPTSPVHRNSLHALTAAAAFVFAGTSVQAQSVASVETIVPIRPPAVAIPSEAGTASMTKF